MRVFIAGFCHESSTFSPIPTSRKSFETFQYYRPNNAQVCERAKSLNGYGAFVRKALELGDTPVLSTYSFAQPSAPTVTAGYESLRDEILDDLKEAGPVDAVLLFLHGAQMAVGYDDCEGDLLARVRKIVGPDVFVGALLDLHLILTPLMIKNADALVACRHYPHIDFDERGEHLYDLARASLSGDISLRAHYKRVPMLGTYYTTQPEMQAVNAAALDVQEREGIASVTLVHSFPWTDNPDIGAGVLIYTEQANTDVSADLNKLAQAFFAARHETQGLRISIDEALDIAEAEGGKTRPVIIAEAADNAGGGAPSDSTFFLARILERGLTDYALGIFWDQVAVQMAFDVGEGGTFPLRLGGKCGRVSGDPLDVTATVRKLIPNMSQHGIGYTHPIGDAVLFEIAGNYVVAGSIRGQVFSPTCFTDFGLDLTPLKGVVVKSTQHFYDQFAPIGCRVVYGETASTITLDFHPELYTRIKRPIWPLDEIAELE